MMMQFMFMISVAQSINAAPTCKADTWRLARDLPIRTLKQELDRVPRSRLIQIAWGEMLRGDAKSSVAVPLLQYLSGTEIKSTMKGFYKLMLLSILRPVTTGEALKMWPQRPPAQHTTTLGLPEICALYGTG